MRRRTFAFLLDGLAGLLLLASLLIAGLWTARQVWQPLPWPVNLIPWPWRDEAFEPLLALIGAVGAVGAAVVSVMSRPPARVNLLGDRLQASHPNYRAKLLGEVRRFWISGYLRRSLHWRVRLKLQLDQRRE